MTLFVGFQSYMATYFQIQQDVFFSAQYIKMVSLLTIIRKMTLSPLPFYAT